MRVDSKHGDQMSRVAWDDNKVQTAQHRSAYLAERCRCAVGRSIRLLKGFPG